MENYLYCDNCNDGELNVDVTFSDGACNTVFDGDNGDEYQLLKEIDITVSIPNTITCSLPVRIKRTYDYSGTFGSGSVVDYITITIIGGTTSKTLLAQPCYTYISGDQYYSEDIWTYELATQDNIPSCSQPNNCTIEITGSTTVTPSILGSSDGSITVGISGQTGSSFTFRLNGGTPQSSATFSGLPSGTYQVRVDEGLCFSTVNITLPAGAFSTSPFSINQPSKIVASENPVVLILSTAVFDGTNVQSESNLTVSTAPENNYKVTFILRSPVAYNVTFTAKDFPNKINYFLSSTLRDSQGNFIKTNSTSEIADSLSQSIENDLILSKNYYINSTGSTITLVAKQASSRFDITSSQFITVNSASSVVSTGVTLTVVENGTDFYEGDILDNYNVYGELYTNVEPIQYGSTLTSSQFDRITETQLPYIKSNIMQFNFSDICKSFVRTPKPDYEFTGFTTITTYMQPFFWKYGEIYPLIANTNTRKKRLKGSTNYVWVCNAALDFEQANDMSYYTGTTSGGNLINVPFLTNSPNPKESTKLQRELLYFIVPQNLNQGIIDIRGDITFWDGSTLTNQTLFTVSTGPTNFGGAFVINTSFDILGLNTVETVNNKIIKKLIMNVYSGNGSRTLTQSKTYNYMLEQPINRVGLSWLNKLGTFDSFDFYGQEENSIDRTAKDHTIIPIINPDGSVPYGHKFNATYDVSVTNKLTLNSGWINSNTFNWLIELLSSNEIYIYSSEYDNYCNVVSYKYTKSSNDTLYSIEIELKQTINENNISI